MNISELQGQIKYITNSQGEKTEVVIPLALWQTLLDVANLSNEKDTKSGLYLIDKNEPKEIILADLKEAIESVKAGFTYPVSELWED